MADEEDYEDEGDFDWEGRDEVYGDDEDDEKPSGFAMRPAERKVKVRMVIGGILLMFMGFLGVFMAVGSIGTVATTGRVCQCIDADGNRAPDRFCPSRDPLEYQWVCDQITVGGPQPGALLVGIPCIVVGFVLIWMGMEGRGLGEGQPPSPDERWGQERPNRDLDRF